MKMLKKERLISLLLIIYTLISLPTARTFALESESDSVYALSEDVRVGSRLIELFFGQGESKGQTVLIPGGDVFGIKIDQGFVSVVESSAIPALRKGDTILYINGNAVCSVDEVGEIMKGCRGESVTITAKRGEEQFKIEVRPTMQDGEYKLGLSLRDTALGIGTVTFIEPKTGAFGGLGHGICDSESGKVISMRSGDVRGVVLGGIHRGERGRPGELTGVLTDKDIGDLHINCECGVFGVIDPTDLDAKAAIPVGKREELREGEATVISTVRNGKRAEYKIKISEIDKTSEVSKSFKITVTDPALIALTGGIVRGMSGSPIIQNGKLVGAVTHVMVADPTEGYGIFIENMLNAAQTQVQPKAA